MKKETNRCRGILPKFMSWKETVEVPQFQDMAVAYPKESTVPGAKTEGMGLQRSAR